MIKSRKSLASQRSHYLIRELSVETWPDFVRLFESHPAPGAHACWCMHNHRPASRSESAGLSRAAKIASSRREKKKLVEDACSHGVLVYADGVPVGWCQYGLRHELPRIDANPSYRKLAPVDGGQLWRIACFVVHTQHRRSGVASTALRAALDAIRAKGGGVAEAYPVRRWDAYTKFRGTVSMFRREGFRAIAPIGESNLLMRMELSARRRPPIRRDIDR